MLTPAERTDERRALVASVRDFVKREVGAREQAAALSPDTEDVEALRAFSRRLARDGWSGISLSEEYGGGGGGVVDACLAMEELWYGRVPNAALTVSMIVGKVLERFGTDAQKKSVIEGICRGEVASIAMSEPGAGSDVAALTCRATPTDDGYILNGQKTWITAAQYATNILLVCRTSSEGAKHHGISMLLVPAGLPGMEIRPIETLGGREVNDVYFSDAFVPAENLVGTQDEGWAQLMAGLNFERLIGAAGFLGLARKVFDSTLDYIRHREQFGQPIGSFQTVKHRMADLATEIESSRLLIFGLGALVDESDEDMLFPKEASMAKLKSSEVLKRMAVEGMQLTGAMGYTKEFGMEAHLRHAMIATVYGGTSEIQREIIATQLGL